MCPPEILVRFSRRFISRSIKPGRERFVKFLTIFWAVYIPVGCVFFVTRSMLSEPMPGSQLSLANAILGGIFVFCAQLASLIEEKRPLLSAWLRVASLAAWLLFAVVFGLLMNIWFGWIGAVVWIAFIVALTTIDIYRAGRENPV